MVSSVDLHVVNSSKAPDREEPWSQRCRQCRRTLWLRHGRTDQTGSNPREVSVDEGFHRARSNGELAHRECADDSSAAARDDGERRINPFGRATGSLGVSPSVTLQRVNAAQARCDDIDRRWLDSRPRKRGDSELGTGLLRILVSVAHQSRIDTTGTTHTKNLSHRRARCAPDAICVDQLLNSPTDLRIGNACHEVNLKTLSECF